MPNATPSPDRERDLRMAPSRFPSLARLVQFAVAITLLAAAGASEPNQPVRRAGFDIQRFELAGADSLPESVLQACVADAIGTNVPLPRVRTALERIQRAYQDAGYPEARVTIHKQVITNGTAVVSVSPGEKTSSTVPPATSTATSTASTSATQAPKTPPRTFEVRAYRVEGNTLIPNDALERILSPATGTNVTLAAIQKAVGNLQLAYRERGFATVGVALPQQRITNASVRVVVNEGLLTDVRVTGNRYFSSNNVLRALPSLKTNQVLNGRVFQRELDLANQDRDRQIYPTLGPGPEPGTSALDLRVKDRLPLHGRLEVNNQSTPGTPEWRINGSLQYNNLWQREHQLGLSAGFTPEDPRAATSPQTISLTAPSSPTTGPITGCRSARRNRCRSGSTVPPSLVTTNPPISSGCHPPKAAPT